MPYGLAAQGKGYQMRIDVKINGMDKLQAMLAGQAKQVKFAAAVALTRTAKNVEDEERKAMGGVFDRPKAQTMKATFIRKATKENLEAVVGIKDRSGGIPAAEYLHPNIGTSGKKARNYKRSEYMLHQAGILPAGLYTVPGKGAKLDEYGNMSRGQIVQILSYFKTFGNTALNSKRMRMTDKTRSTMVRRATDYFVVPAAIKGSLYPGIWRRNGQSKIEPILMFVSRPTYKAIYDFEGIATKVVRRTFGAEFDKAFDQAMRTAR